MKNIALPIVLLLILCIIPALFAQEVPLQDLLGTVPAASRETLLKDGVVMRHVRESRDLSMMPDHGLVPVLQATLAQANLNVITEALMVIRIDTCDSDGPGDSDLLHLYNAMRRVEALAAVEYLNEEAMQMYPLFDFSYRVDDEKRLRRLPDPVVSSIPHYDNFLVFQHLPPFSDVVSRYSFNAEPQAFLFTGENLSRISYRGITVVRPGNMLTTLLVIRGPGYILAYGAGGARVFNPLGLLSGKIDGPFRFRTAGLFRWFRESYLVGLEER